MIFSPNRRWFIVHGRPVLKSRKNGGVITLSTGHHCKNWIPIETSCIVGSEGRCDIPRQTTAQTATSKLLVGAKRVWTGGDNIKFETSRDQRMKLETYTRGDL